MNTHRDRACGFSTRAAFSAQGLISSLLPDFEYREEQESVATKIADAFSRVSGPTFVEAGTGVGKTLAYLIPALAYASPGRRVVIATHTKALQEQILFKDLPLAASAFANPPKVALAKGRSNYLCLRDFRYSKQDLVMLSNPRFRDISRWQKLTETGDRSELDFTFKNWEDIRADFNTCTGSECADYFDCFYYKNRRTCSNAGIIIVNHALFFADVALRARGKSDQTLLPDYDFVIFDEAHHIEAAACESLSTTISSRRIPYLLRHSRQTANPAHVSSRALARVSLLNDSLWSAIGSVYESGSVLNEKSVGSSNYQHIRSVAKGLREEINDLCDNFLPIYRASPSGCPIHRRWESARDEISAVFHDDDHGFVRSISQRRRAGSNNAGYDGTSSLSVTLAPISVADILHHELWNGDRQVCPIFLSATLATNGSFNFFKSRLGLERNARGISETIVGSPFDYMHNCLTYIPRGVPVPSDTAAYFRLVTEEIIQLVEITSGGAFLLFTSHRAMQEVYARMIETDLNYPIMVQGLMPNGRLLEWFRETPNSILCGTHSFWEGVDVPGPGLRMVVIDRIPFTAPDDPLHEARIQDLRESGNDWFNDYVLPLAQVKLKQGFGRLIRTAQDRGVVAILDVRLREKFYGTRLIDDLPKTVITSEHSEIREFFRR